MDPISDTCSQQTSRSLNAAERAPPGATHALRQRSCSWPHKPTTKTEFLTDTKSTGLDRTVSQCAGQIPRLLGQQCCRASEWPLGTPAWAQALQALSVIASKHHFLTKNMNEN